MRARPRRPRFGLATAVLVLVLALPFALAPLFAPPPPEANPPAATAGASPGAVAAVEPARDAAPPPPPPPSGTIAPEAAPAATPVPTPPAADADPGAELLVRFATADGAAAHVRGALEWTRETAIGSGMLVTRAGALEVDGTSATIRLERGARTELTLVEKERVPARLAVSLPPAAASHEATLVRGAAGARLEVELVDEQGAPAPAETFALYVRQQGSMFEDVEERRRADEHGRLVVVLPRTTAGSLELARPRDGAGLHWPAIDPVERPYSTRIGEPAFDPVVAVRPFRELQPGETLRLPAIVVPQVAVRLRGRVTDAAGNPVANVAIGLGLPAAPTPAELGKHTVTTAADGTFAVRATALPDELFVFGRGATGFVAPVLVRPAVERELALTLAPVGALAAVVDVPAALRFAGGHLLVHVVLGDAPLPPGWSGLFPVTSFARWELQGRWHVARSVRDGRVTIGALIPGHYEVRVDLGPTRLATVPNVRVDGGGTTNVELPLPLGADHEATVVRVRDAAGAAIAGARVRFTLPQWRESEPTGVDRETDANGEARFVVPRGATADVEVAAKGLAPAILPAARFPLDVTLSRGATLALALGGIGPLTAAGNPLVLCCRRHAAEPPDGPLQTIGAMRMVHHPQAALGADGTAAIELLPHGRYRAWLVALPAANDHSGRGPTFVSLGDHDLVADTRYAVAHTLTDAEVRTLRGR
jgi:hypothetical protein